MKPVIRTFALLVSLAGLSCFLALGTRTDALQYLNASGVLVLPALSVWLTSLATPSRDSRWILRAGFWAVAVAAWLTTFLLAQGRWESSDVYDTERQNLMIGFGLAFVVALWVGAKKRTLPTWSTFRDIAAGVVVLALAAGIFVLGYDAKTCSIAAQAEARWTEIGLPMAEFEKSLVISRENAGSEVARQLFREFVRTRFYKEGTAAADREPEIDSSENNNELTAEVSSWVGFNGGPSDDFEYPKERIEQYGPATKIELIAPALDDGYRRILAAEAPVWAANPHDGYAIDVPNFLGIRKFCQLTATDAVRRFAAGDSDGAARALAAGMRIAERLPEHPTLVAFMIRVATDALFIPRTVRLPATGDDLGALAKEVATKREKLLRCIQIESWVRLRQPEQFITSETSIRPEIEAFPKWVLRIANPRMWRRDTMAGALNLAEHAAIFREAKTLSLSDFGGALHEAVATTNPTSAKLNFTRSAMRMHATLLLREQTELIRLARARLAAGLPVESRDSIVLPSARWELVGDAHKNTVTTRLLNAPEWIVNNTVITKDFWLLPLDGSVAWQFRPPTRTVSVH
jgi:hypothetical protein